VRRACIDIGSNTTRLLVADCGPDVLRPVHQERAFTHLGRGRLEDGTITRHKLEEVTDVVAAQVGRARELGAADIRGIATAAIRQAPNGAKLADAVRQSCGLEVEILTTAREAALAFMGASRTLGRVPAGALGVVDVGGGSSEMIIGSVSEGVTWSASFELGSGDLTECHLHSDPPLAAELEAARSVIDGTLGPLAVPHPAEAVAVGGSAASLPRLAGPMLDAAAFATALRMLAAEPARVLARRFELDIERVRLLPAGLLILQAAAERFAAPLGICRGGIREGFLLEAAGA
jgi:exopolyphosphatase / guanosine-5'-triphosphate,3'-diphosphate pyrophosphatase